MGPLRFFSQASPAPVRGHRSDRAPDFAHANDTEDLPGEIRSVVLAGRPAAPGAAVDWIDALRQPAGARQRRVRCSLGDGGGEFPGRVEDGSLD
jgi:hypothetical protein